LRKVAELLQKIKRKMRGKEKGNRNRKNKKQKERGPPGPSRAGSIERGELRPSALPESREIDPPVVLRNLRASDMADGVPVSSSGEVRRKFGAARHMHTTLPRKRVSEKFEKRRKSA